MHRGHMIASQCGRGDQSLVYTNGVPQFGPYNSGPWQVYEGKLIVWGKKNCARNGAARNVQMFIVAGAIPSIMFGPSKARSFGTNGFSDYQDREYRRVNVPKRMWDVCANYQHQLT